MTIVKSGRGKAQWLKTEVKGGKLVISVGVDTLAFAAQRFYDEEAFQNSEGSEDEAEFRIVDADEFAESVLEALEKESEDGTTPVHLLLDAAFKWLTDYSAPGGVVEVCELPNQGNGK